MHKTESQSVFLKNCISKVLLEWNQELGKLESNQLNNLIDVSFFTVCLTKYEVFNQFEFILFLVFQHSLEIFFPAWNVHWMNRLVGRLSWRHIHLATFDTQTNINAYKH